MKITLSKNQWAMLGVRVGLAKGPALTKSLPYDHWVYAESFGARTKALFLQEGVEESVVDSYITEFDKIRKAKPKSLFAELHGVSVPVERRNDILAYRTFHDLEVVVDYVKGQWKQDKKKIAPDSGSGDYASDKMVYQSEDGSLKLYRGDNPRDCINIKGSYNASWCVASASNNMYYAYRMKPHEPTFYFVRDANDKPPNDFVVVQVTVNGGYLLTNANNDGDRQVSWDDLVKVKPSLKGLQAVFKHVPLKPGEREEIKHYQNITDDQFAVLTYEQKDRFLDVGVMSRISDDKFSNLPDPLKNKYIAFGLPLTIAQQELIAGNSGLQKTYERNIRERVKRKQTLLNHEINLVPNDLKEEYFLLVVAQNANAIQYIQSPSLEIQLAVVNQNVFYLKHIRNPFLEVQLAAVKKDGHAIQYIKDPSEAVKLAAVNENGLVIWDIRNPSIDVQLAAVKQEGVALEYIQNPSLEIQLAAVNSNGNAIRHIQHPPEEIQMAAVKQNGSSIQYIQNPSEEVQLAAVNQSSYAIRFIRSPSIDVQLAAVKKDGLAVMFINKPSLEAQLAAVRQNGRAIKHIYQPSDEIQRAALSSPSF